MSTEKQLFMKKILFIITIAFAPICIYGQNTTAKSLNSEMSRLETETVLVLNSQEIDYYPLWSPNSDFIAFCLHEKWFKIRLDDIEFEAVKWRGQKIGLLVSTDATTEMSEKEVEEFKKVSKFNSREVTSKLGTKVELPMQSLRTSLVITHKGEDPKTLWTSGGENCHSLVLSPNEKYVAYLCELNGLLIMKIE
jgi:hypothetical protein